MEGLIFGGIVTLFLGFIVLAIVLSIRADKKRAEAILQFATQMGFTYEKKLSGTSAIPCREAAIFDRGRSRYAKNFMTGKIADVDLILTDYQYTTGSGKNSTTYTMTLAAYHVPGLELPDFALENENFLTRIAEKFGMQDIDFDSHPDFSKRYRLTGKDENAVRKLFTSTLLTSIENGLIRNDWRVQAGGGWLIIHSSGKRLKPEQYQDFLNDSFELTNKLTAEALAG
ncbi:MAG TPA: hypothetical protein DCM28_16785 [Phycisphaerales bacterium]|nr:hypothetical protein [Phycisphaerales bacterium]HCD32113.1 hypothetical protein [Phycisphaerales bacterium]|tara:strand:+ start:780 stop:1463 length:684 start_codon:yes stop_codon:yes gene_type:complete